MEREETEVEKGRRKGRGAVEYGDREGDGEEDGDGEERGGSGRGKVEVKP